jgi:hypothetical protein
MWVEGAVGGAADLGDWNPGAPNGRGAYTVLLYAVKFVTNRRAWMHGALLLFLYPIFYSIILFSKCYSMFLFYNIILSMNFLPPVLYKLFLFNNILFFSDVLYFD